MPPRTSAVPSPSHASSRGDPYALAGAPPKVRRTIITRALQAARRSGQRPSFESLEVHLVAWDAAWDTGIDELRQVSPRVANILETTVFDTDMQAPVCADDAPVPAIALDNLTTDEAAALLARGWLLEDVVRFWPGPRSDRDGAIANTAARARAFYWSFYRSTSWGFIYPKAAKKRRRR